MRPLFAALILLLGSVAHAGTAVPWTRDPDLIPWETMTTSGDPGRTPARTLADLSRRRARVREFLDGDRTEAERAAALAELGDLFRDEARIVLEQDAADPWRVPLRTSPAWLQLEFAQDWYGQALAVGEPTVDADGRLSLLRALIATRLGRDDSLDDVVRVIRAYRGTPYVEMAKLAVGDHHYREGDLERARAAYKLVRSNRDPELSSYARYRLASVFAAEGESAKAIEILESLLDQDAPGPLLSMLRDGSRSALANHLASDKPLTELITWLDSACPAGDAACERDVRTAAADAYRHTRQDRADAWLRTVDDSEFLEGQLDVRLELARRMLAEEPVQDVLFAAEDACGPGQPGCRAEHAHLVATFYDEVADPDGGWLQSYVRLPRIPGRPELQRFAAELARNPRSPSQELSDIEALCTDGEPACRRENRTHLRVLWGRLARLHDSAWLHFVDAPPQVPGPPDHALLMAGLVRERATGRQALAVLEPACGGESACVDLLFEVLVDYYATSGMDREASWLMALKSLPELPIQASRRAALRDAALEGADAPSTLRALLRTCATVDPSCFENSRLAAEVFFRAAARHGDAVTLRELEVLGERAVPDRPFAVLVDVALDGLHAGDALARLGEACQGLDDTCGTASRTTLAAWYDRLEWYSDKRLVEQVDAPPDLGDYARLGPAFQRVVRTAPSAEQALVRVEGLCPVLDAECARTLREALSIWYTGQGRHEDAATVQNRQGRDRGAGGLP